MTSMTINELFSNNRVWVSQIDCINWGTFDGHHSATLTPDGLMVTGETGAGKSTLIDGYITLLQGTNGRYNVAAAQDGQSRDRDVLSYIRGYYASSDSGENDCLRSDTVASAIRARFTFEDGRTLIAALILSIEGTSRSKSDVKRMYILMNDDLSITDLYRAYAEDKRRFKKQLSENNQCIVRTDSYKEYRSHLLQSLGIENENAISLLCRAMGLKQIRNLDEMLRSLVLEEGDFKQRAESSLEESAALHEINDAILDAEEQIEELETIKNQHDLHSEAESLLKEAETDTVHARSFFAHSTIPHLLRAKKISKQEADSVAEEISNNESQKSSLKSEYEVYRREFENFGGNQIEALEKEADSVRDVLETREEQARLYANIAQSLSLNALISLANFEQNRAQKSESIEAIEGSQADTRNEISKVSHKLINVENEINSTQLEIDDLAQRRSNVPMPYQKLRDKISEDLNIDPESLIYMAEIMKVKSSESEWQGAIERALGMRKLTLLVPAADEHRVTQYVNRRHLGLNFKARSVTPGAKFAMPTFKDDGFLRKLDWKDHPYRETVKNLLAHIDLKCVTEAEISMVSHAMTKEGLIHYEKGQFSKDDRHKINDKTRWSLGFSSQDRMNALNELLSKLEPQLEELSQESEKLNIRLETLSTQKEKWEQLNQYTWDAINFHPKMDELKRLEERLEDLRNNQQDAARAEEKMRDVEGRIKAIEDTVHKLVADQTRKDDRYKKVCKEHEKMELESQGFSMIEDSVIQRLSVYLTDLSDITDSEKIIDDAAKSVSKAFEAIHKKTTEQKGKISNAESNIKLAIKRYKSKENWEVYSCNWGLEFEDRHEYIEHYSSLVNEGLPNLKERFQNKLNSQTTSSLSSLVNHYRDERLDIQERIESINKVLERTNFTPRSYLRIDISIIKSVMVQEFEAKVQKVLQLASTTNESLDARKLFKALEEVNVLLREALSNPDKKANKELIDVRYQMSFTAVEVDRESGTQLNRYGSRGTQGKSGGEKESFTGIILAASLAYVLTPDGTTKIGFSTVFLDEAFSNMSAAVIRRVIQVFKEMGLVLNIITPFKNMDIAKDAASSVLIADKDAGKHRSRLIQMSWEEAEKQLQQHLTIDNAPSNQNAEKKSSVEDYEITVNE
ncbi:ATP-binding protein [Neptuniibacter marinus]|uniref:ATP-binding protein n=1 Tax=Neptuniibacter marinus TaxID=1806670 RepID=UPI003B592B9E